RLMGADAADRLRDAARVLRGGAGHDPLEAEEAPARHHRRAGGRLARHDTRRRGAPRAGRGGPGRDAPVRRTVLRARRGSRRDARAGEPGPLRGFLRGAGGAGRRRLRSGPRRAGRVRARPGPQRRADLLPAAPGRGGSRGARAGDPAVSLLLLREAERPGSARRLDPRFVRRARPARSGGPRPTETPVGGSLRRRQRLRPERRLPPRAARGLRRRLREGLGVVNEPRLNFARRPFRDDRPVFVLAAAAILVALILLAANLRMYADFQRQIQGTTAEISALEERRTRASTEVSRARAAL